VGQFGFAPSAGGPGLCISTPRQPQCDSGIVPRSTNVLVRYWHAYSYARSVAVRGYLQGVTACGHWDACVRCRVDCGHQAFRAHHAPMGCRTPWRRTYAEVGHRAPIPVVRGPRVVLLPYSHPRSSTAVQKDTGFSDSGESSRTSLSNDKSGHGGGSPLNTTLWRTGAQSLRFRKLHARPCMMQHPTSA